MILLIISFLAGVLTILAPCTLPLLPIIVGSSVNGQQDKKKPFIIAGSLGVSVILFTLLLKSSTFFIHIPQQTWSLISGSIIIIFGLISLFPGIWERLPFVAKLNLSSNRMLATGYKRDGIIGDIIIGASLGPVFSTCSPTYFVILATVLPQSFFLGFMYLLAYAIGLSGVLLLVAFLGQKIVDKLGGVSDTHGWFKRTLGLLFLIIGIAVVFGVDKVIERKLLESGLGDITKVEQKLLGLNKKNGGETLDIPEDPFAEGKVVDTTENSSTTVSGPGPSGLEGKKVLSKGPKSPDLLYPSGFINTDGKSITIAQYKGKKVVLLDIWTYSCINCQRTIPYINAWYEKYKPYGLEVIGLHTPEFAFEKVQKNVEEAVKGFNIKYPVVMDNEYATWNAFGNQFWPRKYLININGEIIYDHIGEGDYEHTETVIQKALQELNDVNGTGLKVPTGVTKPSKEVTVEQAKVRSPEIYFGSSRNTNFGNGASGVSGEQKLALPATFENNKFYLDGTWSFDKEFTESKAAGKLVFNYNAKTVYMVASSDKDMTVQIYVDGKFYKDLVIKGNTLYKIVEGDSYGPHKLEISVPRDGVKFFTFTFG